MPISLLKLASNKLDSYHGFTFWRKTHIVSGRCDLKYAVGLKLLIKQTIISIFVSSCKRSVHKELCLSYVVIGLDKFEMWFF